MGIRQGKRDTLGGVNVKRLRILFNGGVPEAVQITISGDAVDVKYTDGKVIGATTDKNSEAVKEIEIANAEPSIALGSDVSKGPGGLEKTGNRTHGTETQPITPVGKGYTISKSVANTRGSAGGADEKVEEKLVKTEEPDKTGNGSAGMSDIAREAIRKAREEQEARRRMALEHERDEARKRAREQSNPLNGPVNNGENNKSKSGPREFDEVDSIIADIYGTSLEEAVAIGSQRVGDLPVKQNSDGGSGEDSDEGSDNSVVAPVERPKREIPPRNPEKVRKQKHARGFWTLERMEEFLADFDRIPVQDIVKKWGFDTVKQTMMAKQTVGIKYNQKMNVIEAERKLARETEGTDDGSVEFRSAPDNNEDDRPVIE